MSMDEHEMMVAAAMSDATLDLRSIGAEMNAQDHRSTLLPLYVVVGTVRHYGVEETNADGRERVEEPTNEEGMCAACDAKAEHGDVLPDDCVDCEADQFSFYSEDKDVPHLQHGVFLTSAECDEYIAKRRYDMPRDAHSYAISAWRSRGMSTVLATLSLLGSENGVVHHDYRV